MKEADSYRLIFCIVLLVASCVACMHSALGQENREEQVEKAIEIARDNPAVKDILTDFPDIRLEPHYSEEHSVWIIEFLYDDREFGVVSVSTETGSVLEVDLDIDRITGGGEREDEEEPRITSLRGLLWQFRPRFEGTSLAWMSFILVLLFAGNFSKLLSMRNLDIILLYMLCPFLNVIWQDRRMTYTGIFIVTLLFFTRAIAAIKLKPKQHSAMTFTRKKAICIVLILAAMFHIQTAYEKGVDDSGIWSVIGGKYLAETGKLPYGTQFGWNCVYGPLMYVIHVPINSVFPPDVKFKPNGSGANWGEYGRFETRGAKTNVLIFDFLAMLALYLIGKRYRNETTGLLFTLVYALNPYILGLGGGFGLQQTSHITGIPFVLFAILFASRPLIAGTLLGLACGILYYPIFLFPLWIGYYSRNGGWKATLKFLIPIAVAGCICIILIMTLTVPSGENKNLSSIRAFINDTVYQQQFKEGYGTSSFSFWGQHPALAEWAKPITGIAYLIFCVSLAFVPFKKDIGRLIALTAAVLIGTQLVLSHGGGTYIGFYIAPFIITLISAGECEQDNDISI